MQASLEQAIEAQKAGRVQEAEGLYRAILLQEPYHSDANHNLGILAISVKNYDVAIPLLKTALETNPRQGQYWLSYINALIGDQQIEVAISVLAQGKKIGLAGEQVSTIEKKLNAIISSSSIKKTTIDRLFIPLELRELGEYKKAQEWLISYLENHQDEADAWSLLSHVLLLDKQEEASERALTTAASINPDLTSVSRNQARLLLRQAKPTEALVRANTAFVCEPEEPENLVVLASCLAANQRDEEALTFINKALVARPNYSEAYVSRAFIRLRGGDMPSAINDLEKALSLKPHLCQIWELLGAARFRNKDVLGAIEALQRVDEREPTNINNMVTLGEYYKRANMLTEAILILEKATTLKPKNANAWATLGVSLQQLGNIDKAKVAYINSLSIDPNSAEISCNLGAIEMETRNWESARLYFERATILNPAMFEAHSNLGVTLQELGQLQEAVQSYQKAIELKPNIAQTHCSLGDVLYELARHDEAEMSYRKSIVLAPDYAQAHSNLGSTLQALGRFSEAEECYRQAISIQPNLVQALNNLGNTLHKLGQIDEAEFSYRQAIALVPNYPQAQNNLANTLKDQGRLKEAEATYRKAIALEPELIEAHNNLGNILQKLGRLSEAEASYRQAIDLRPDYAAAHCNLALLCLALHRQDDSVEYLKKVMEMDSGAFRLKAAVNLSVIKFLNDSSEQANLLLAESRDILTNNFKYLRNEATYHVLLTRLIDWHRKNKKPRIDTLGQILHVVGESHALSSHSLCFDTVKGGFQCKTYWIAGCKQWHLGSVTPNEYKEKFKRVIETLPDEASILLSIGEIDCRLYEGIHKHGKDYPEKTRSEIILATIETYLSYVNNTTSPKSIHVVIQGVPCPNIDVKKVVADDLLELINLIKEFNLVLCEKSKQMGYEFLDLRELTDRGDGYSNGIWNIDQYHLSPAGMIEAWQRHLGSPVVNQPFANQ